MAITYPITDIMTSVAFADIEFEPLRADELSHDGYSSPYGKELHSPLWRATYTTDFMTFAQLLTFEAKLNSLKGVLGFFTAGDLRRPFPAYYPTGVFNDTGKIASVSADGLAIALNTLPASFRITVGDYIQWTSGGKRSLHQAAEAVIASSTGITTAFEIFPAVREPRPAVGTAVVLKNPTCYMTLVPGSIKKGPIREGLFQSISFSAIQRW